MRIILITGFLLLFALAIWYVNRSPEKTDNLQWADMPALLPLSQKPQSSFLLTPENAIPAGKNAVYAPAFYLPGIRLKRLWVLRLKSPRNNHLILSCSTIVMVLRKAWTVQNILLKPWWMGK